MDEIVEELTNLNLMSTILNNNDREKFDNDITSELNNIIISIQKIKDKIFTYQLPDDKANEIDLERRRQKIIWKMLFPQYWAISYAVNNSTINELAQIEDSL